MGRIMNAAKWLEDAGVPHDPGVQIPSNDGIDSTTVDGWAKWLRKHDVYYSTPLDLDMMMTKAFPNAYQPTKTYDSAKDDIAKISMSVFGEKGLGNSDLGRIGQSFSAEELHAYKNLFKSRAKPASHYNALGRLSDEDLSLIHI